MIMDKIQEAYNEMISEKKVEEATSNYDTIMNAMKTVFYALDDMVNGSGVKMG